MSKEAIKLALEALERYQVKRQDFDRFADEITALQKALVEQPAQQALDKMAENARELGIQMQPEEPRAWFTVDELNAWADKKLKENPQWAEQPAQQEPVGEVGSQVVRFHMYKEIPPVGTKLYTSPPAQRTWVGLTDEEIVELHHEIKVQLMGTYKTEDIYRAIEAKLKDKNNG